MSRVKLKIPNEKPLFSTKIPVRIGDVNYGGHVGNDAILSLIHEARVQLLNHFSFNELNAGGNSLIMADVMIAYRGESFYGDLLTIDIYSDEITPRSFDLIYVISTTRNNNEIAIADAKTGMVCFDYNNRKIDLMTEALKNVLTKTD